MTFIDLIRTAASQAWRQALGAARALNRVLDEADGFGPVAGEERIFQPPATLPAAAPRRRP